MGTFNFAVGALIQINGVMCQLLRMLDEHTWQIEEQSTRRIREYTLADLREMYCNEELLAYTSVEPVRTKVAEHTNLLLDAKSFDKAKLRRMYVQATLGLPITEQAFAPVIQSIWEKSGAAGIAPNWTTVYRWRSKFLRAGKDIAGLADENQKKGNRSPRFPSEVIEIVDGEIDSHYMIREPKTAEEVLGFAILKVRKENKLRPESMQLPEPTRRLIRTRLNQISMYEKYMAHHGRDAAQMKFRAVIGNEIASAPLQLAQIDHTLLDIFVVDDNNSIPLGRPWLTVCVDDYTRCVLGVHISFEPPSYITVAKCLRHAFLPKSDLHSVYPNIVNDWNAHGVMAQILVDNGMEFHSEALEQACYSAAIEIRYAGRKKSWIKGKIERFQGTLNRAVSHGIPGTTFSNIFQKGDYDPKKHAILTLRTLKEIIHLWIVDYYHQKPHRSIGMPPDVSWKSNVNDADIRLVTDMSRIDAILGKPDTRRLSHKGIEYDKLFYNSEDLRELRTLEGELLDVDIRVDDSDLGWIYVFTPNKRRYYKVPCIDMNYAKGISRWQHTIFKRFAASQLEKYDSTGWLEAKQKISDLVTQELKLKKARSPKRLARFKNQEGEKTDPNDQPPLQHTSEKELAPGKTAQAVLASVTSSPEKENVQADVSESTASKKRTKIFPIHRERTDPDPLRNFISDK